MISIKYASSIFFAEKEELWHDLMYNVLYIIKLPRLKNLIFWCLTDDQNVWDGFLGQKNGLEKRWAVIVAPELMF